MKILLDIPDNKQGLAFLKRTKALSYVLEAKKLTTVDKDVLMELAEVKKAHKLAALVKAGKLKTRSAKELRL